MVAKRKNREISYPFAVQLLQKIQSGSSYTLPQYYNLAGKKQFLQEAGVVPSRGNWNDYREDELFPIAVNTYKKLLKIKKQGPLIKIRDKKGLETLLNKRKETATLAITATKKDRKMASAGDIGVQVLYDVSYRVYN